MCDDREMAYDFMGDVWFLLGENVESLQAAIFQCRNIYWKQ